MKHKSKMGLVCLLIIIIAFITGIIMNHFKNDFQDLNQEDQSVLTEYDALYQSLKTEPLWDGFDLDEKPILFLAKDGLGAYLVNANKTPDSIWAKKIELPEGFSLQSVYRVSFLMPQLLPLRFHGDFNTINKKYDIFDNDVYYLRYDKKNSLEKKFSAKHLTSYLAHESFHYYMQNDWPFETPPKSELDEEGITLFKQECYILGDIQKKLQSGSVQHEELLKDAKELIKIVEKRLENNKEYVSLQLEKELNEGTATYVGIKAAKRVGYDLGVMYFDNRKEVPFSEIPEGLETNAITMDFLFKRFPYESGAQIGFLLDALNMQGWQQKLNMQNKDHPVTLYTVLKEYIEKN